MLLPQVKGAALALSSVAVLGWMGRQAEWVASSTGMHEYYQQAFGAAGEDGPMGCDPTSGPGYVTEQGYFSRFDVNEPTGCASQDLVNRFAETPRDMYVTEFASLRNKTMFLLGDSVTRHLWDEICDAIGAEKSWSWPEDQADKVDKTHYSEAAICKQHELNLTVLQYHQYGFSNATDPTTFGYLQKCFPGGPEYDFETRVPRLFEQQLKGYVPDYVQVGGGAWDFLYMFNRDILEHRHHDSLPVEDQVTFSRQVEGLLNMVSDMWPEAKTVFLEVHPLNSDDLKIKHIWGGGYFNPPLDSTQDSPLLPPLFAQRRLVQHSMALKAGAKAAGVDTLDYWKLKDSFSVEDFWAPGDAVHPHKGPRVAMIGMMLEKMMRWTQYGV